MKIKALFVGGARYSQPLNGTSAKKFRALKALGELFVIGFSQDIYPRQFTEHAHFYLLPKLPLPALRYGEMFVLGPLLICWLILWHNVHILVAQSPYEGLAAAWAKKLASWLGHRVVLVVESHGDFEESLFLQRPILLPGLYHFLMRCAAGFTFKHADILRAVSCSTKEQLERWAPGKPIVQFPTWTDIEVFLQAGLNQKERPAWNILYAGVLTPLKGVHHLINAFARIARDASQTRLVIVGHEENTSYAAELRAQIGRLGIDECIQFVGEVSQAELAEWMRRACVFVLPTYSEGLPRVVFEAMATRLPVVSSPVSGIPEIVEDGVTGFLVPPGDEAMLAERLRWLLAHPNEAYEMGRRARAFAECLFSTEMYVRGYKHIFELAHDSLIERGEHASSPL
jgi:glycosyltransferase involved in cell wall biosynthesis